MAEADRTKYLRIALLVVGLIFIVGIYPLTIIWPSGWSWHTGQSDYLQMILGIYATLGVFLLVACRNPLAHLSLIWFTVWSSVVHGGIMTAQSLANSGSNGRKKRHCVSKSSGSCGREYWRSAAAGFEEVGRQRAAGGQGRGSADK
jgi:hypothetical protein